jgi:hypothetical protein
MAYGSSQPHTRDSNAAGPSITSAPLDDNPDVSSILNTTSATEYSYVGRGAYLGGNIRFTEDLARSSTLPRNDIALSDVSLHLLHVQHAYDLPPRAVRDSLIAAFMERIHPWMPIVEPSWLIGQSDEHGWLLLQHAVFLAASRVSHSPSTYASSEDFYTRARTLFFHGQSKNTLLFIVAALLLQWWHPNGPETVSMDSSGFWSHISIELAYQVGLHIEPKDKSHMSFRRKLWWSLVVSSACFQYAYTRLLITLQARDSVLSVGLGRPRAINGAECTVKPPSIEDFQIVDEKSHLFVAHVSISRCMGNIAEAHRQKLLSEDKRQIFENELYRWIHQLPVPLRLYTEGPEKTFADRRLANLQLHVAYFACLLMLYKDAKPDSPESTAALIAASFISGILEDVMARDEARYLPAIFPFYALAAGLVGLSGSRYPTLCSAAEADLAVVKIVLEQLGQRWQSAKSALVALNNASEIVRKQTVMYDKPKTPSPALVDFFNPFGPELCRCYHLLPFSEAGRRPVIHQDSHQNTPVPFSHLHQQVSIDGNMAWDDPGDALPGQAFSLLDDPLPPVGSWLFDESFFTDQMSNQ